MPFLHNTLKKTQLNWTWTSDTKWMDNKSFEDSLVHRPASLVHGSVRGSRPPALRSVGTVGWNWRASVATTAQPQAAPQQPVASMAARTATVPQIRCTTLTPSRRWVAKGVEGSPIERPRRQSAHGDARLWAAGNELAHASPVTSATGLALRPGGPVPIPCKAE